jgi:hypothetical protein
MDRVTTSPRIGLPFHWQRRLSRWRRNTGSFAGCLLCASVACFVLAPSLVGLAGALCGAAVFAAGAATALSNVLDMASGHGRTVTLRSRGVTDGGGFGASSSSGGGDDDELARAIAKVIGAR